MEMLKTIDYIHGLVRVGNDIVIGDDHEGIVRRNWGKKWDYITDSEQLSELFLGSFGKNNIDMSLVVLRTGNVIEVGGYSSFFFLPDWRDLEYVRPITIARLKETYPNLLVTRKDSLRRNE